MQKESEHLPKCIGFIMDGNRRWAKEKNIDISEGHKKGGDVFLETARFVRDQGISNAVFYAFSTENWNRPKNEVEYIMKLALEHAKSLKDKLNEDMQSGSSETGVRFRFIGDASRFNKSLKVLLKSIEEKSYKNAETTIWVALSYGGRAEIVDAVNKAIESGEKVSGESLQSLMWTRDMPDPDLIVRTGGQQRLSNFLTWQSAYSELVFLEKHWPDLTSEDLDKIINEYSERNRTFGK